MNSNDFERSLEDITNGLPEGWASAQVRELMNLINGYPFKPSQWKDKGLPIIRIQNLNNTDAPFNYCSDDIPEKYLIKNGDLLFAWSGTPGTSFGAHLWNGGNAWLNQHIFRVEFNEALLDKRFLRLAMNHNLNDYIAQAQGGVGLAHITKSKFEPSFLRIPPLAEQKRIVRKIEELLFRVNSTKERMAKVSMILKRFRQTVLTAACSGRLTADWRDKELNANSSNQALDGNEGLPNSWSWRSIRDVASSEKGSIQSGPFGSNLLHSEFQPTGILVIGIDNVFDGKFTFGKHHRISHQKYELLKKYAARPLDVLVTVMATVGRCCVVPSDIETAIITKHVYRITADHNAVNPYYLMQCIRGCPAVLAQIQSETQGVTRPGINGGILKRINIPLPPITEQHEIVRRVESIFELADAIEKRLAAATVRVQKLTQAILAKAFRGELVPTEAEVARREGRSYESASELLARIKSGRESKEVNKRRRGDKTHKGDS